MAERSVRATDGPARGREKEREASSVAVTFSSAHGQGEKRFKPVAVFDHRAAERERNRNVKNIHEPERIDRKRS